MISVRFNLKNTKLQITSIIIITAHEMMQLKSFILHLNLEMFYLNSTLYFGIPLVLVFQLEVDYKVDRLLTSPTAQQSVTAAQWDSNNAPLLFDCIQQDL